MTTTPPSKPMVVEVLTGPPGCGKSTKLRNDAISAPGLYLFFCPTLALIREQVETFRAQAPTLPIYEAHSDKGSGPVQRKLDDARKAAEASGAAHAIVFTTHDALMARDLSGFAGWHARVDEAPQATQSGRLTVARSWTWFADNFDLVAALDTGWWSVELRGAPPKWREVERDALLKPLGEFIKLASSPGGLFVNVGKWEEASTIEWWSIWTPLSLRDMASVRVAGAAYQNSLGWLVVKRLFGDQVTLVNHSLTMVRAAPPTINIHYFTEAHEPSTSLWEKSEGRFFVKAVADFLGKHVPDLGFWTGNTEVLKLMEWRVGGDITPPKVAGRNQWREATACACIYSSGPTEDDMPLLQAFELLDSDVRRAREDEDILQYIMRGALRDPSFSGEYRIYLYAKRQAETLASHLSGVGSVNIVPLPEAAIMKLTRVRRTKDQPTGLPSVALPKPTHVEGKRKKFILTKSAQKQKQRAKRTPSGRKPGRPPKTP